MGNERKVYTAEFKRQAISMSQQPGATIGRVAAELGISRSALETWLRAYRDHGEQAFPGHGKALLSPEQAEIMRLRKENERLKEEKAILKKAAAFFAKESQ